MGALGLYYADDTRWLGPPHVPGGPADQGSEFLLCPSGLFPGSETGVPSTFSKGTESFVYQAVLVEPWHSLLGQNFLFPDSHTTDYFLLQKIVTVPRRPCS